MICIEYAQIDTEAYIIHCWLVQKYLYTRKMQSKFASKIWKEIDFDESKLCLVWFSYPLNDTCSLTLFYDHLIHQFGNKGYHNYFKLLII